MLRQACTSMGCQLPLVQDTSQLSLLARDVQAHPSVPGALLITASLRNDAAFAQPYPALAITLSDVNGKRLAMRRLRAAEYLGDIATLQRGLPPGLVLHPAFHASRRPRYCHTTIAAANAAVALEREGKCQ
jgi:hypothetical protein